MEEFGEACIQAGEDATFLLFGKEFGSGEGGGGGRGGGGGGAVGG